MSLRRSIPFPRVTALLCALTASVATAWTKAQADYTRVVLDRIPQRAVLLSEIQKYGDAAPSRTFGIQVNGNHIYYYKRLASENIPKLYVRKGIGGKERLLVDPEAVKGPEGQHYACLLYTS